MKQTDKKIEEKLRLFNQTRERVLMPRPCRFDDKTKYSRNRQKQMLRREFT